jgi:hypothetical protein
MFKSNWRRFAPLWIAFSALLLAVSFWLVWIESASLAEQRIRGEQSTQSHIEYANDRIDKKCLTLNGEALRDCIQQEIESARDHDRANNDLNAQQQMALFTKVMGYTAVAGLVLGAVSIAVIFATLREMGNTNRIMREDQRPWLVIKDESIPFKALAKMYRGNPLPNLTLRVTNKGRLPARDAIASYIFFSHDTVQITDAVNWVEGIIFGDTRYDTSTVFQGETTNLRIVPLPRGKRMIGRGSKWSLMVVCAYLWEDETKWTWKIIDTSPPPENVLKHH